MSKELPEIPEEMLLTAKDRPDQTGIALLQARHVLNEWENQQIEAMKNGQVGFQPPVHYYAWGLFKTTLLKVMKNRADLLRWSPEMFQFDKVCYHCAGNGKTPIEQYSPQYREYLADHLRTEELIANGTYERTSLDTPFNDGDPLFSHCTPCQGSGILTILDQKMGR